MTTPASRRLLQVPITRAGCALCLLALVTSTSTAQTTTDTLSAVFAAGRLDAHRYWLNDRREFAVQAGSFGAHVDTAFLRGMKQAGRRAIWQTPKTRTDALRIRLRELRMGGDELTDSAVVFIETEQCHVESGVSSRNTLRYPLVRVKHGDRRRDVWIASERAMMIKAADGTCDTADPTQNPTQNPTHDR